MITVGGEGIFNYEWNRTVRIHFDSVFQTSISVVIRSENYKVIIEIIIPGKLESKE